MSRLTLYHCPRTCSQVTLCALEEAGLDYELKLINILAGEQHAPNFRAISPLGKVPAAVVDGQPVTENIAILTYIARSAPDAAILPGTGADPLLQAQAQSGLAFCSGTLHPLLRGISAPQRLTAGDDLDGVRRRSAELLHTSLAYADDRLGQTGWWLGQWSIVDVYLNWALAVAQRNGFDATGYPTLLALPKRLSTRPSFCRMLEIDEDCFARLGIQR